MRKSRCHITVGRRRAASYVAVSAAEPDLFHRSSLKNFVVVKGRIGVGAHEGLRTESDSTLVKRESLSKVANEE